MVGGFPAFATGASNGKAGTYLAYASAAGSLNDVAPAGFGGGVGILDVTLPSGDATWTGLTAGADRQVLTIANADAVNNLTLAALNSGSVAANQFRFSGDLVLPALASVRLVYSATAAKWIVV
jgi:hypothetical protein